VARQGTIAGTHVRLAASIDPILIGRKSRDCAASAAVGQRVSGILCLIGCLNFHMPMSQLYHATSGYAGQRAYYLPA
jgi:hypothetical protein